MDPQERLTACEAEKHDGNALFKAGNFQLAWKKYDKECDLRIHQIYIYISYDSSD